MPHSSGGGGSSGGSFGGSYGGSAGGSFSPKDIRSHHFVGCYTYRKRKPDGTYNYIYTDKDIDSVTKWNPKRLFLLIFYLPLLLIFITIFSNLNSKHVNAKKYSSHIILISDNVNFIDDKYEVRKSLENFQFKTGITPSIFVQEADESTFGNIDGIAFDEYVATFGDEYHWLILFLVDSKTSEWKFIGMQGDNTDSVLTEPKTKQFNEELTNSLISGKSFSEGFCKSFDNLTERTQKFDKNDLYYFFVKVFVISFLCLHCYFMIFHNSNKKYSDYEYVPNYQPEQNSDGQDINQTAQSYTFENAQPNVEYVECIYCGINFPKNGRCPTCGFKYY